MKIKVVRTIKVEMNGKEQEAVMNAIYFGTNSGQMSPDERALAESIVHSMQNALDKFRI